MVLGAVIQIPAITVADGTPADVLELAKKWDMEHCIIIGHDPDGVLAFGGTTSDLGKILMLLERAKHWAISEMDD